MVLIEFYFRDYCSLNYLYEVVLPHPQQIAQLIIVDPQPILLIVTDENIIYYFTFQNCQKEFELQLVYKQVIEDVKDQSIATYISYFFFERESENVENQLKSNILKNMERMLEESVVQLYLVLGYENGSIRIFCVELEQKRLLKVVENQNLNFYSKGSCNGYNKNPCNVMELENIKNQEQIGVQGWKTIKNVHKSKVIFIQKLISNDQHLFLSVELDYVAKIINIRGLLHGSLQQKNQFDNHNWNVSVNQIF